MRPAYVTIRQLKQTAEQFRAAYWPHRSFPVNIELIIERDLKMDIIPINGMQRDFGIDAYLVGDFSGIVVDGATYEEERFANRLRFSFAHEIGHFLLHRSLYARESPSSAKSLIILRSCSPLIRQHGLNLNGKPTLLLGQY